MRVSEIRVKRIRVNQGLNVHQSTFKDPKQSLWPSWYDIVQKNRRSLCPKKLDLYQVLIGNIEKDMRVFNCLGRLGCFGFKKIYWKRRKKNTT